MSDRDCCLNNVTCDVVSCVHHVDGHRCDAEAIHVGDPTACSCLETRCNTYKEKK